MLALLHRKTEWMLTLLVETVSVWPPSEMVTSRRTTLLDISQSVSIIDPRFSESLPTSFIRLLMLLLPVCQRYSLRFRDKWCPLRTRQRERFLIECRGPIRQSQIATTGPTTMGDSRVVCVRSVRCSRSRNQHARLFPTYAIPIGQKFLTELCEKHDVSGTVFLVDDAADLAVALRREGFDTRRDR